MNDTNAISEVLRQHQKSIERLVGRIRIAINTITDSCRDELVGEIHTYPEETFENIMTAIARTLIAQGYRVAIVMLENDEEHAPQVFFGECFGIAPSEMLLGDDQLIPIRLLVRQTLFQTDTRYTFFIESQ